MAAIVGIGVCAGAAYLCLEKEAVSLFMGEVLGGGVIGVVFFVGAMIIGGEATRSVLILLLGNVGGRAARAQRNAEITKTAAKFAFPWFGVAALLGSAALLFLKPIVIPLTIRSVSFADPPLPPSIEELGYFNGAHMSFVVAGGLFVLMGLALASAPFGSGRAESA